MKKNMQLIKKWFLSLSLEDKFSFLFSSGILLISLATTLISSVLDLDSKWIIRAICIILSGVSFNSLWEQFILISKLEKKVDKLLKKNKMISSRSIIESEFPLYEMWKECSRVQVASMGCTQLFRSKRDLLEECVIYGTEFEFVLIDPNSAAMQEHLDNKCEDRFGIVKSEVGNLPLAIDGIKTSNILNDNLKFYYTSINLPYALMIVEKKEASRSFIKVDLYSIDIRDSARPSFIVYSNDDLYPFFLQQYDIIKRKSKPVNG